MSRSFNFKADLTAAIAGLLFIILMIAGWVSNVIWTFNQESTGNILLGILGCLVAPVGAFHGIYTWF